MKPIYIDLRHLRTLLAIEETGSLSLAAERVCVTQSALSHQIKGLEDLYSLPLLERKTQPVRFTPAGTRLLKLAHRILPQVIEAELDVARLKEGEAGELRIAIECHTCFDWLMPAMDLFRQSWPLVELDIVSGFHTDPVGLLLSHRADWAVVSEVEPTPGINFQPLFSYEMVGICAKDHPLASKEIWEANDFKNETLITYPVSDDMLDVVRKVLEPANINPARRTSELTIAIVQLVASKRGIATLPYWAVLPYLQRGYVIAKKITPQGLTSELYAATRENMTDMAYIQDFFHTVQTQSFATLPGLSRLDIP
ncbi:LysR family transcriptional regulator [Basilea psittacipulmonis]|uniref:HTH-type transcriptional regulator MetR n=1 Tax=Basilea psittacipulmonis DSM 24701 TaxID=1072685 RepID=A0A077DCI5_9BURK|nr:LysR family transcriptional regulator [Basilea psittacipulmonis]AIL32309.1 LysR family transcriptional regulator [Basilea psittacipulmonis DSM 24701]